MWVPPKVADSARADRREYAEALPFALEVKDHLAYWDKLLQEIDPHLTLVKARTDTQLPGLRPGYYHVVRHNPDGPPSMMVVEGPGGEFREPDSAMLDQLREHDMWSQRALDYQTKRRMAEAASKARQKDREREERVDDANDRLRSLNNGSILVGRDI